MCAIHKGSMMIFQGVILLFLAGFGEWGWTKSEEETKVEPARIQFGDPDSTLDTHSTPCETCSSVSPSKTFDRIDPAVDQKVREIIKTVKPGDPYPDQFGKIIRLGEPSIPSLLTILKDTSFPWQHRWISAMALGRFGGEQAFQGLNQSLSDPLTTIREGSVLGLSKIQDPKVLPLLRKALSDPAMVVRDAAVKALKLRRDHESVPLLNEELHSKRNFGRKGQSLWIRKNILMALGDFGHVESNPAILSVLNEKESRMRILACEALSKINPKAFSVQETLPPSSSTISSVQEKPSLENCVQRWLEWKKEQKL